jgi:hypothetical protein
MPADTVCAAFQETAAQRRDEPALRTKDGETEITVGGVRRPRPPHRRRPAPASGCAAATRSR